VAVKKTEPDSVDTRFVYLWGRGYTTVEAARMMGVTHKALRARVGRLYELTHTKTYSQLMYWMLSEYKFQYPKQFPKPMIDDSKLQLIQLLADGYYREDIRKKLNLTDSGYDARLRAARRKVRAKTNVQLVAICWTEDWIT
jgi:DNA-binding CsgD family transcriptional regulator